MFIQVPAPAAPDNQVENIIKLFIPVLTFLLGLFSNLFIERYRTGKKLDDLEVYYSSLITYLYHSIFHQRNMLIKSARGMKAFKGSIPIGVDIVAMFTTSHIKKIDTADLYKLLITEKDGANQYDAASFMNMILALDTITNAETEIPILSKKIVEDANKAAADMRSGINEIRKQHNERILRVPRTRDGATNDDVVKFCIPLFNKISAGIDTVGADEVNKVFIEPLLAFFSARNNADDYLFRSAVVDLASTYKSLVLMRKSAIILLVKRARSLNHTSVKLKDAALELKLDLKMNVRFRKIN